MGEEGKRRRMARKCGCESLLSPLWLFRNGRGKELETIGCGKRKKEPR
jgi:hypothetical protein